MKKICDIVITAIFTAIIFGFGIASLAFHDADISVSERRVLAKRPALTSETFFSGYYAKQTDLYFFDHFPARELLRSLDAHLRFGLFGLRENNGVMVKDGFAAKIASPLDEKQIKYGAAKFNKIIEDYLNGSKVYISVIPDKNYYLTAPDEYNRFDYERLIRLVRDGVPDAVYIDLFEVLSKEDYYRTDIHWNQPRILPAAQELADKMGLGASLSPEGGFTAHEYYPFYGSNFRYSALPFKPDTLVYLTSRAIDEAVMTGISFEGGLPVYAADKLGGLDAYDVFAAGPQAVLTVTSPLAKTDRELIIFRDSFGSSVAPLLLEGYAKVTLVDLRYIPAALLDKYIGFHGQDVLFLYSTTVLNSAMILK